MKLTKEEIEEMRSGVTWAQTVGRPMTLERVCDHAITALNALEQSYNEIDRLKSKWEKENDDCCSTEPLVSNLDARIAALESLLSQAEEMAKFYAEREKITKKMIDPILGKARTVSEVAAYLSCVPEVSQIFLASLKKFRGEGK